MSKMKIFVPIFIIVHVTSAFPSLTINNDEDVGCFWHLTDIHYDQNYKNTGENRNKSNFVTKYDEKKCWEDGGGKFGDYNCDSSLDLVESVISFMKTTSANLQCDPFVIWTGDDNSHAIIPNYDNKKVIENIEHLSARISALDMKVYPVLGNHDIHEKSQFPIDDNSHYEEVAKVWANWLGEDEHNSFKKGGYYVIPISKSKLPFRLIGLNTNVYYTSNKLVSDNDTDPLGQFGWLEDQLEIDVEKEGKVLIFSHVPPGKFERYYRKNGEHYGKHWFRPTFNKKYLELLNLYSEKIVGQFYGHQHTDSMRVFSNGTFALNAPAITPWRTTLAEESGSNNPAVRLVKFNTHSGKILDYDQYYLDLFQSNDKPDTKANWQRLYSFKEFGKGEPSAKSISEIAEAIMDQEDQNMFDKYHLHNTVSYSDPLTQDCDENCKAYHYCSATKLDYDDFDDCINQAAPGGASSRFLNPLTLLLVALFSILTGSF